MNKMLLKKLESLMNEDTEDLFQSELNKAKDIDQFSDGDTLFHRLIRKDIPESIKIKFVYKLTDYGIDINAQNSLHLQTCLHIAVIRGLADLVFCLLQNGADLTITDQEGLCAYNRARRLEDQNLSKRIISKMQSFYPTYWIGIDNMDINIIRRLANSWCRFKVKKKGKCLIEYAKEKNFREAYELFRSLETTMDLLSAVLACNVDKVESIVSNNSTEIKLNFKNMKENNATILYYAIRQNNFELLKKILKLKPYVLGEYLIDEFDIDYPLYFTAIKHNIDYKCFELITPNVKDLTHNQYDISNLYYRGMSFIRYSIENNLNPKLIEDLMNQFYCSKDLITVKDPNYLTCREYSLNIKRYDYVEVIDKITVDYLVNSKKLRMELALNGYDFSAYNLKYNNQDILIYAKENKLTDLSLFLENVNLYQEKINEFHDAVEKNDYFNVKAKFKCNFEERPELNDIFYLNLITSKKKNEAQSVLFKAVLNGYYEILNVLLELIFNEKERMFKKFDEIRDHCFRTPMHYANGYNDNRKMSQLLSQFGFSENVFDKDGMTPLDFQERIQSEELQELILNHKLKKFKTEEPNPWTWQVWTRIQREKNTLKQLISFSNEKTEQPQNHGHGHSHDFQHKHSNNCQPHNQEISNINENTNCAIL